jgi:glyoxalase family protein
MENTVKGIHHITAIAGNAKRNFDFYTKVLGLRLVKKTVNFDDPETYHLYYGDKQGTPGTILTFFPWENIQQGRRGSHQVTEIGYFVPENSLQFWANRFDSFNVTYDKIAEKFNEPYLSFSDPDGLKLELIAAKTPDARLPWETDGITAEHATRGFYNVTITTNKIQPTADILTGLFGYRFLEQHKNIHRYITDSALNAAIVDLLEIPGQAAGHTAGGSVHHIAFRVRNEEDLMFYRDKIVAMGLNITEKIDRNYFYSLYFREPGGVLFELATDNPGFDVDEPLDELGKHLKLPVQYERYRETLEKTLPKLI